MSSLLEKALERVRAWPRSRQDDLARMALDMDEQGVNPYVLSEDERRVLEAAWRESEAEDFASDEEIEEAYRRFSR
ncbi:MAG TPA: hypothetical protein VJ045_06205 [Hyphomicrobiaceae bacterium]|nr:hypothetical protein [Hyphomicrobiaceae bacterium]